MFQKDKEDSYLRRVPRRLMKNEWEAEAQHTLIECDWIVCMSVINGNTREGENKAAIKSVSKKYPHG